MLSNCFCFVLVTSSQRDSYQLSLVYLLPRDVNKPQNGLFQKKLKQVGRRGTGLRIFFCENSPGIFLFSFTLPLEIPDKAKLNPFIFHKIVLDPLEISRPKTKIHGNPHYFFLVTLRNFTSFLIRHAISLIPLEIPYLQNPPVWIFSGKAQLLLILHLALFYYLSIIIADQT